MPEPPRLTWGWLEVMVTFAAEPEPRLLTRKEDWVKELSLPTARTSFQRVQCTRMADWTSAFRKQ